MGVVYRAHDLRLDQPRAIKFIRLGPFSGEQDRERFNREARAVARLDHPGVVRIYALGEHAAILYICMEFVAGGSLQARLRQGPLGVREAADLVRQLALAVQHAHDNQVLHRDLKPANVLLTAAGTPKVSDFGLAKLLDADEVLTQTGALVGTPPYMAPEQAEGRQEDLKAQTDVWALGVIFYECLTGKRPFKGENKRETLEQVKKRSPVSPRRLRTEIPVELEAICLKCLQKRPGQRYATAGQLAADLQTWLDGKALPVPPRQRGRRLAAVAVVLFVGLLAGGVLLLPRSRPVADLSGDSSSQPEPGVWQPLLTREPTVLLWPEQGKSTRLYQPASQELVLSCPDEGLLALGRTTASRYRLAVTIEQHPWAGNIGLFFGFQDRLLRGEPDRYCQVLKLFALPSMEDGRFFRIDWKAIDRLGPPEQARVLNGTYKNSTPFRLGLAEHTLEAVIGPNGLETVLLDDKKLPELNAASVANPPAPADYQGLFGVYVANGSGVVRDARYLFSKEPQ
jgi:serine/threonine protein kinase